MEAILELCELQIFKNKELGLDILINIKTLNQKLKIKWILLIEGCTKFLSCMKLLVSYLKMMLLNFNKKFGTHVQNFKRS